MSQSLEELQAVIPVRYRVEKEVGRGGMAAVYVAEDEQFGRRVAIKVLHPDLGSTLNAERFAREIRVLAQLNHPNILPVLDSGEVRGVLYYVMPFIDGETLAARLERERQLPVEDAVAITCEVSDALSYAHAAGIVHRDIKPENVLLSGGHAVVADFGIARLLNDDGTGKLTATGMSLGTAAYMSPEQSTGEKVDARADIYSLGCLLYELLVGAPPFTGPNAMAVMARHAMEPPPGIRIVRPAVPEEIEAAVMHALEKAPVDRFRTVAEFKAALLGQGTSTYTARYTARYAAASQARARTRTARLAAGVMGAALLVASLAGYLYWRSGAAVPRLAAEQSAVGTGPPPSSVAVMYFSDQSADGSLRHIADGLTESLIEQLAGVAALDVVTANGVRPLRGVDVAPDSVSRALGVGTLVRGAVAPAGDDVRITVDLVEALSGVSIARRALVFPAGRLQEARDSVAAEVATMLRAQLGNEVRVREQQRATESTDAWIAVQRAEKLRKDADSLVTAGASAAAEAVLRRADAELVRAGGLDPAWSEPRLLRAAIAHGLALANRGNLRVVDSAIAAGLGHARAVLRADPRNARAHELEGQLVFYQVNQHPTLGARERARLLQAAESSLVSAVRLDRLRAGAWATLSALHYNKPDLQAAALAAMNAYEADAYLANARTVIIRLFSVSYDLEQYNEALKWCDTGRQRFPQDRYFSQCRLFIMWMRAAQGQSPDSAWHYATEFLARTKPEDRAMGERLSRILVAGALARGQLQDSARAVLLGARADATLDPRRELAGTEAAVRVILGDHDEAVRLIQDYLTVNPSHLKGFATRTGWWWRDLQTHPRFTALLAGAR